jgi:purine-binding chemotaxis protein CheW
MEDVAPTPSGQARHFLTFRLDDRLYGVSAAEVAEVIPTPTVVRIPQSPAGLMGLANLRGAIIPVASGRRLLGQGNGDIPKGGRAIVLNGTFPIAFAVDEVSELLEVSDVDVHQSSADADQLPGELLNGSFQPPTGRQLIKVLDIPSLLKAAIVLEERPQRRRGAHFATQGMIAEQVEPHVSLQKLVSFMVAEQEYALPLQAIQEINSAPETVTSVPQDEALVLGVTNFRDQALPLLSLRGLLGFPPNSDLVRQKVAVTTARGHLFGLVVDEMGSIIAADETRIDPIPNVLAARSGGESRIAAIYRGVGDQRLVSILSPDQIFGDDVMQRLSTMQQASQADTVTTAKSEMRQFIVFRLGAEEFALPIEAVEEVARAPDSLARVPNTPKFLEGVINLRGQVLPVVDQRKRFSMPPPSGVAGRRLVVVRTKRHLAGIIVDSASDVLRVAGDEIASAPQLPGQNSKLIVGAINLAGQKRIVLVMDPDELLSQSERSLLDKATKEHPLPGRSQE